MRSSTHSRAKKNKRAIYFDVTKLITIFPNWLRLISLKQWLFFILSASVSTTVFLYLKSIISFSDLLGIIRGLPLPGLLLFALSSLTMSVFRTWRYSVLLGIGGHDSNNKVLFLITLVRNLFSDLLPARLGTLIYIYLVRTRLGVSWSSASSSFAYSFLFDILSLSFLILLATITTIGLTSNPELLFLAGLFLACCSCGIIFFLPQILKFSFSFLSQLSFLKADFRARLESGLQTFQKEISRLQKSGMLLRILMLSFGVRCYKYLALYILLLSLVLPLGYHLEDFPLPKVFLGLTAAEMAASLPISGIAGFGAYEGAWSLVFQLLGYSEKLSALTSISHHLLTQAFGYSLGGVAFLFLLLPWQRKNQLQISAKYKPGVFQFYFRFIMLYLFPLLCAVLFFSVNPSLHHNNSFGPGTSSVQPATPTNPPKGVVVFQKSDGIYTVLVGKKKENRLIDFGGYPRWSADGKKIAFIDDNRIMMMTSQGQQVKELATTSRGIAVCFHPDGHSILFTDKKSIKQVDIHTTTITTIATGNEFFELDISNDGRTLVVTEKEIGGYRVVAIDLATNKHTRISRGCSASISPNGNNITVSSQDHRELLLFNRQKNKIVSSLQMIKALTFDNQYWSNSPDWITSQSEDTGDNIFLHHVPTSAGFQLTFTGGCDRPDYFIFSP